MDDKRYDELLKKLNGYVSSNSVDVSPTQKVSGVAGAISDTIFLSKEMDVEKLTYNEKILAHVLLHNFFSRGGIKNLNKGEIIALHKKVVAFIPHNNFDVLDEK